MIYPGLEFDPVVIVSEIFDGKKIEAPNISQTQKKKCYKKRLQKINFTGKKLLQHEGLFLFSFAHNIF